MGEVSQEGPGIPFHEDFKNKVGERQFGGQVYLDLACCRHDLLALLPVLSFYGFSIT